MNRPTPGCKNIKTKLTSTVKTKLALGESHENSKIPLKKKQPQNPTFPNGKKTLDQRKISSIGDVICPLTSKMRSLLLK